MAAAVSTKKDKTRKLALSTGISLFVCIGGDLFLGYGDLVYAIFVGLLSVIIIGPILMITRIPFLRVPRTKWWVTAGSYLLHPLLGIILCGSAGLLHTKIPMGAWVPTEPAPEKPARFVVSPALNIFGGSINIETESGNLYTYEC